METTISVSSIFGGPAEKIWELLGRGETLKTIAKSYAYFKALDNVSVWKPGAEYRFKFRVSALSLWACIKSVSPCGTKLH
jgi:hypothetical protein